MEILKLLVTHWAVSLGVLGILGSIGAAIATFGLPTLLLHWKACIAALVTLVLTIVILFLYADLERVTADAATDKANYAIVVAQDKTLSANNLNLVAQLKAQGQSITDAASDAFAAQAASKAALLAAQAQQVTDASKIASLQARATNSKTDTGSCDDEISIIRSGL